MVSRTRFGRCSPIGSGEEFRENSRLWGREVIGWRASIRDATTAEALRCTEELRPDVTLVDVHLGAESGFELARQLHLSARALCRQVRSGASSMPPGLAGVRLRSMASEESDRRHHPAVNVVGVWQVQFGQHTVHMFLDGAFGDP